MKWLCTALLLLAGLGTKAQWATHGNAGLSADAANYVSMAIDGNGTKYIAYHDDGNSSKTTVMKDSSGTWVTVGTAGFSAGQADYVSLAIDDNDTLYVAYKDGGNSNKTTVMKYNGSSWVTVGSAGFSAGTANFVSLAIDNNDTLYVAYQDAANSSKATVMKYNGSSWVNVGSAGFTDTSAVFLKLAIDDNGTPYVAATHTSSTIGDNINLYRYSGSSWGSVGSNLGIAPVSTPYCIDLAIDSSGTPYVGYIDDFSSDEASVKKYNGSSWVTVGSRGFSAGDVAYISLAIDDNNTPYIAYQDGANSSKATVMKYNGSSWVTVGSTGFSAGVANYVSLAIDDNGIPYVAYQDGGNSSKATVSTYNQTSTLEAVGSAGFVSASAVFLKLAIDDNGTPYVAATHTSSTIGDNINLYRYSGSSWGSVGSNLGIAPVSTPYCIDLAIDSSGTPYVGYIDDFSSDEASVKKYNGSSWVTVGSRGFSAGDVAYISLAIDDNNTPYIAYQDDANSSKATVMKYNGSSWVTVGSAGFSAGGANYVSLAIDGNGTPYVAYHDDGNSSRATVMKYNGSSWVTVGTAGFSAGAANYTSLAIDGNGTPYVAYHDDGNSSRATVMKYNGSSWVTVGTAGFSAGAANYTSLAIDGNGKPYVAYQDGGNSSKITLMKYNGSSWVSLDKAGFSAGQADFTSIAIDENNIPYIAYKDGAVSNRPTVQKFTPAFTWTGSWGDALGLPDSTDNVLISANSTPASFSCDDITIESGYALSTGSNETVTIYGGLDNKGNGVSGQGTLIFTKDGTAYVSGDTVEHEGTVIVESGCTLTTNSKLRLTSDASNTGRIGESEGTITGDVIVQRYMPGKRCFRFYGHPFSSSIALNQLTDEVDITGSGGAANGFTATQTNSPSAFYWDISTADTSTSGANPGWKPFTSANDTTWDQYELLRLMVRGAKGEGLTGGSYTPSAATFEGVGPVNQSTQVITLTKGSNSEFVACGNPFPSPVEMDKVARGSNVGANYYAWDATSGSKGAYVTNAWTLAYDLPAYAAFFTTVSANSNNTLTFEEQDKASTGASLFKTTAPEGWVELTIHDSTTKWDRLLINLNNNGMVVEDKLDGKKLYNPGLDFFTLSKDDTRLAVDVRPYDDGNSIPLGLTAYNRYNKYVIKTGMFDIPMGTKLYLHDKYLNKKEELVPGFEYWFDVTADSLSQGMNRFEINMQGKPTGVFEVRSLITDMQLIPNPAGKEVKVSFKTPEGNAILSLTSMTGQVVYTKEVRQGVGSVAISLTGLPAGMYIVELKGDNVTFTEKLIKE